jgi:hypothetical protein
MVFFKKSIPEMPKNGAEIALGYFTQCDSWRPTLFLCRAPVSTLLAAFAFHPRTGQICAIEFIPFRRLPARGP